MLITYNVFGGYGHPDHVQAHRVAMYAAQLAGVESYRPDLGLAWTVQRILWNTMSRERMVAGIQALRDAGDTETMKGFDPENPDLPMVSNNADIAAAIDARPWMRQKLDAMLAHASQIRPDGPFFAGAEVLGEGGMWIEEHYCLAAGVPFPGDGWADDLFEGLS